MRIGDWSSDVCSSDLSIGLVGESGCGKSTVAMAIIRYLGNNGAIVSGQVLYKGRDMATLSAEELRQLRGNEIAMVYQEPMAALNPAMTLGRQLMEVPLCHENIGEKARSEEHTSELQSLMRISYAVFCLKKKKITNNQNNNHITATTSTT